MESSTTVAMEVIKGRMYDYNNGRFLSVDPFIQNPTSTQSMNPYTYIFNNPLSGTDPSGYACENTTGKDGCKPEEPPNKCEKTEDCKDGLNEVVDENGKHVGFLFIVGKDKSISDFGSQAGLATDRPDGKVTTNGNSFTYENGWYANQQGIFNADHVRQFYIYETNSYGGVDTNPVDFSGWELFIPIPAAWIAKLGAPAIKALGKSYVMYLKKLNAIKHGWDKINTPASRHFLSKITQGSLTKRITTVIDNSVDVAADMKAIRTGQAVKKGNQFHINDRIYQVKPNGTTIFPVSGSGFHTLDRATFQALGIYQKFGNTKKANTILNNINQATSEVRSTALNLWRLNK